MRLDLKVTKKQKQFIDARENEVLFGGAAGGGKSYGQIVDALLFALDVRKNPTEKKKDPKVFDFAETMAGAIQRFNDVLEMEIRRAEE